MKSKQSDSPNLTTSANQTDRLTYHEDLLATINNNLDGIIILDRRGIVLFANPAAQQIFDDVNVKLLGAEFGIPYSLSKELELQLLAKDATSIPVKIWASETNWQGEPALRVFIRDLTAQYTAAQAVEESELKYRTLFETMKQGVVYFDVCGEITSANPASEKIYGLPFSEMQGKTLVDSLFGVADKDGRILDKGQDPVKHVLTSGTTIQNMHLQLTGDYLDANRWVQVDIIPQFKPNQEAAHQAYMTLENITDLVNTRQQLEATLADLQYSNDELQQFAYIVSHDLNEPLRTITSFIQLLKNEYVDQLDDEAALFIDYVVDGASRMKLLIDSLLAYARVNTQAGNIELVNCNDVLTNLLDDISLLIAETNAQITIGDLPTVRAYFTQIRQVFQNLISNAIKFRTAEPPHITINAKRIDSCWEFCVADNGIGIDSRHHDHIFLIFQRLHTVKEHEGTGIGLAIVKKIIEHHGGAIWLESEVGQGSKFFFTLPAA